MFGCILDCFITARNSCFGVFHSVWMYFGLFRYCTNLDTKRVELVQLMHKFVPWNRIGIFRNEHTRSTPLDPNSCFGASRSIWVHLVMFCYYTKLSPKRVELVQLMHKFVPWKHIGSFCNKCTWAPHWTQNSCIGAFRSVWVHFGLFHYCTKVGTKWAELV